jgi:hypothetical protein
MKARLAVGVGWEAAGRPHRGEPIRAQASGGEQRDVVVLPPDQAVLPVVPPTQGEVAAVRGKGDRLPPALGQAVGVQRGRQHDTLTVSAAQSRPATSRVAGTVAGRAGAPRPVLSVAGAEPRAWPAPSAE